MNVSVIDFRNTKIAIALISFLFGFLIISQIRSQAPMTSLLEMTEQDLTVIIREQILEVNLLREEYYDLKLRMSDYERTEAGKSELLNKAAQDLQTLKILAGVVGVEGDGIRIMIKDPDAMLQSYDVLEVINELRSAGAEAVAINGLRLNAQSYFSRKEGVLYVGEKRIMSPYRIEAIGDRENLYQSMVIPGGVEDTMVSLPEVTVRIEKEAYVKMAPAGEQVQKEKLEQ